jgi:hypothetical protein
MSEKSKEELFSKVGFSSTDNIIEDCAGNDGMVRGFPGLTKDTIAVYEQNLARAGGILNHPDIMRVVQRIGREPKFALALKTILNSWAEFRVSTKDFSLSLESRNNFEFLESNNEVVDATLKKASLALRTALNTTLKDGKENKKEVREIGLTRFKLTKDFVFPFIEELVKLDIKEEELNQAAKKAAKDGKLSKETQEEINKQRNGSEKGKEQKSGKQQGTGQSDEGGESQLDKHGEGQQVGSKGKGIKNSENVFDDPSTEGQGIGESQETSNGGGSSPSSNKPQLTADLGQDDEAPVGSGGHDAAKDNVNPDTEPDDAEDPNQTLGGNNPEDIDLELENPKLDPNDRPIDVSKLSKEAQDEIKSYKDALTPAELEVLKEAAKRLLEDLDDSVAEALKPKTTENDTAPTHKERKEQQEELQRQEIENKAFGLLSQAIRNAVNNAATPYQTIYRDIAAKLDTAEEAIREFFKPEDDEEWQGAFPTGQKLNKRSPLKFEADPTQYNKLFYQRNFPTTYSYEFDLVIDRSGSMDLDGKLEQTKRAAVYLVELLNRFKVPCSIRIFNHSVDTVKKWQDEISDEEVQNSIAESLVASGVTNDALALGVAYEAADERTEKHKYIIVFSDAESGAPAALKSIVEKIQLEGQVTVFHFGIGANTKDSHGLYAHSKGDLPTTGEGAFFDVFTQVLEEMILDPYKFKGQQV